MPPLSERAPRLVVWLLLVGIAALFITQLISILAHRLDYPIVDDWRYYLESGRMPNELSLEWLFAPAEDTLHVTGKLLDWLYFHAVSHDYRQLALTSFVLFFGGWLVCAVLLCLIVGHNRPVIVAPSLLAFAFPLANVPYWVASSPGQWLEPAIAYHQMLPVLGLMLISLVALSRWGRASRAPVIGFIAVLSLAVSLVYSSGAISMLVFGIAVAGLSRVGPSPTGGTSGTPLAVGATVAAVAGACLLAHVIAPLVVHDINPITETRAGAPAFPWSASFWHFFLGLFDRAVLSTQVGSASLLQGAGVALVVVLPLLLLPLLLWRGRFETEERDRVMVLFASVLAVVCYSVLVTYGRASMAGRYFPERHPPEIESSLYAHTRFFYWWISAILPLTVLSWGAITEKLHSRQVASWAAAVLVLLAILPKGQDQAFGDFSYLDHWRYSTRYARDAAKLQGLIERDRLPYQMRKPEVELGEEWANLSADRRNRQFRPADRNWMPGPRRYLFLLAEKAGATFVERWGLPIRGRRSPK